MAVYSDVPRATVHRDNDFTFTVTIYSDTALTTPQNITGWAISFVMVAGSTTISKTVGSGITITNGASGACSVVLTDTDLATAGEYRGYIKRTDDGYETTLWRGLVPVESV